ncbi:hypothetical protein EDB84DRAFT_1584844 [Lactarius hengduanensis]|nr:hypothetical protein EDB84DRAFT_1584844 [Lactarius hengduanensis]
MALHTFLFEHAKFPFPALTRGHASSADISRLDLQQLAPHWKAQCAVQDGSLIQKLCRALEDILGEALIPDHFQDQLLPKTENHTRALLDKGIFPAVNLCFKTWHGQYFRLAREDRAGTGQNSCRVDYTACVGDVPLVLIEAKSPSVMMAVENMLPPRGITFKWVSNRPLVERVLLKAALYLGLKKMEWLFLTCHNYWIVCRLVTNNGNPFLAYSPSCSIENNSQPFRAFLGAILSVRHHTVTVQASVYDHNMEFDDIEEDREEDESPEDDFDDGSGTYRGSTRTAVSSRVPTTRSRATTSHQAAQLGIMITSSSPNFPKSFQSWIHLRPLLNNTLVLPHCAKNGKGYGSTGNVWQGRFDNSNNFSDAERRQRLYDEFGSYESGRLHKRITPRCYGAYKDDGLDALILELCDSTLKDWDELNLLELDLSYIFFRRNQIYDMVQDLHRTSNPRNIARVPGGFRLIDFSESTMHTCVENLV